MGDIKLADTLKLNVGGTCFMTTRATLCKYPTSMLGAMFRGDIPAAVDETGAYFIDRDGSLFGYVLNFLRSSRLTVPEGFAHLEQLAVEADFFQIEPLTAAVNSLLQQKQTASQQLGCTLEIIEVRMGMAATMPTNNSRVKTIISGRRNVISSLPSDFFAGPVERLQGTHDQESFTEMELHGSNVRLRLAEYLRGEGWQLVKSDLSSSSGYDSKSLISSLILEQSFRDSWFLPRHVAESRNISKNKGNCSIATDGDNS